MGCAGIACLTVALLGIDSGWEPMSGGGVEYFLQIQPSELESLNRPDETRISWVPSQVRDVRKITLTVGTETLARIDPPTEEPDPMPATPMMIDSFEPATRGVDGEEAKSRAETGFINNIMFDIGLSFYFPMNFKYSTFR